jgi:hypothetical protein
MLSKKGLRDGLSWLSFAASMKAKLLRVEGA